MHRHTTNAASICVFAALAAADLTTWTKHRVAEWAERSLDKNVSDVFLNSNINGRLLRSLDGSDLDELIPSLTPFQKKRILMAIEDVNHSEGDAKHEADEADNSRASTGTWTKVFSQACEEVVKKTKEAASLTAAALREANENYNITDNVKAGVATSAAGVVKRASSTITEAKEAVVSAVASLQGVNERYNVTGQAHGLFAELWT